MLDKALKLLKIFEKNGYEAYLVGGYVRDYILNKKSTDFDICTNATPMQIKEIFKDVKLPFETYGSVHLTYKNIKFEITTYRMDLEYKYSRIPSKIMYTDSLIVDLKRRDFTMNTLCMDKNGNIIDLLNAISDIKNRTIKCVGNANDKLKEDALRILRAIRFSTVLGFKLDDELKKAIKNNRELLNNLSYYRKKEELNRIFSSPNTLAGLEMIKQFGLEKYLGIKIGDVVNTSDPIGIWAQVYPCTKYQFNSNEKSYISSILALIKDKKITDMELYKKGNYVCYIAGQILKMKEVDIYDRYDKLPIKNMSDIAIKPLDIVKTIKLEDKRKLGVILKDLETKIINRELINDKKILKKYVIYKYNTMV